MQQFICVCLINVQCHFSWASFLYHSCFYFILLTKVFFPEVFVVLEQEFRTFKDIHPSLPKNMCVYCSFGKKKKIKLKVCLQFQTKLERNTLVEDYKSVIGYLTAFDPDLMSSAITQGSSCKRWEKWNSGGKGTYLRELNCFLCARPLDPAFTRPPDGEHMASHA